MESMSDDQKTMKLPSTALKIDPVLTAKKKALRSFMKQRLSSISNETVYAQSALLVGKLTKFQPYLEAKRIGIYLSMPTGEIQTDAIVRHALGCGKKVFVPYLYKVKTEVSQSTNTPETYPRPRSVMDMVDLRSVADYDSLKPDSWGIPSIGVDTINEREHILKDATGNSLGIDLILMPGVAFDIDPETGLVRRLGHGKGFYDYFLERYEASYSGVNEVLGARGKNALLYGLALEEQFLHHDNAASEVDSVAVGPLDRPLHGLLLGNGEVKGPVHTK